MKNKCFNFIFFSIISLIINASEQKKWSTTVSFLGHFKTPLESWPSSMAKVKVQGFFSNAINPEDGKRGILHGLEIIESFGQKPIGQEDASDYVKPTIDASSMKKIREASLWNYRAFELKTESLEDRFGESNGPHLESLCEFCQLTGKNCATKEPVVHIVSMIKPKKSGAIASAVIVRDAVLSRGGAALSRGGDFIITPRAAIIATPLVVDAMIDFKMRLSKITETLRVALYRGDIAIEIPRSTIVVAPLVVDVVDARKAWQENLKISLAILAKAEARESESND